MKKGLIKEATRLQQLAGILKESDLGAAYAERELDGDASRQMHEEPNGSVTLDMDPKHGDNVYIRSTKQFGTWHDWGWAEDEDGNPSTAMIKLNNEKELKEFPLADIEVYDDEEEEEPERDADFWRDIKYDR
jgi:hypothetical protein